MSLRIGDLFSGGGGVTLAAELSGYDVVFAANHWPAAVALHRRHFPHVPTAQQDLCQFDFSTMPDVDILWASPSCQGNSEAAQPSRVNSSVVMAHDSLRSTAWAVVAAVLAKRPRKFVVENVPEFREWTVLPTVVGEFLSKTDAKNYAAERASQDNAAYKVLSEWRVTESGRVRVHMVVRLAPKGVLFDQWLALFRAAGYSVTVQVLTATRWGTDKLRPVPQRRRRLIIVGHLGSPITLVDPKTEERHIGEVLEPAKGPWAPISSIDRDGARARAEHADQLFGGRVCWGYHVSHKGGWARSVNQPSTTVTTQNQHYLVKQGKYRLWTVPETAAAQGFPRDYFDGVKRTAALVMAGNAVPVPMAAGILQEVVSR